MSYEKLPELFPEEKAMPLAKYYYNYPMRDLPERSTVNCREALQAMA